MKIGIYSAKSYEQKFFLGAAASSSYELIFISDALTENTVILSQGCKVVCCFVTDRLDRSVLQKLVKQGVSLIALRSAGYDHVDLMAAKVLGLPVVRVPAYSPQAIAEFTLALILALSRQIVRACNRVSHYNFSLDGLLGFNISNRTLAIIGTGNIGTVFAKIMSGFDCKILAYDPKPNDICRELGVTYTSLEEIWQHADIISLHCLLNTETHHLINEAILTKVKKGVMLINTGRGALMDSKAIIESLKKGTLGFLGIDVYENEKSLFFKDHSEDIILDDQFIRLQAFPNVLITGHQAYFSQEALENIARITIANITAYENGQLCNLI